MAEGRVVDYFENKTLFITGATGFMGKVFLEKLLYSCEVKKIFILIRFKKGKSPSERFDNMWKLPMFERLMKSKPMAYKKVVPLVGELYTDNLGLKEGDLKMLINETELVYHIGATLKLEANLKDAIEQNTTGTARVIDIAKQMKNLKLFVYYSTAFCSADLDVFEEKVYPCKDNPRDVIDLVKWMNPEALELATTNIIKPHPNTYTYSKRLAEVLVANEHNNMRVVIIRPSIVIPAMTEPLPGWVDNLNGPMGLLVGGGKGVIRSMYGNPENFAHVIPVDVAIFATMCITQKCAAEPKKPKEVPVYNLTQHDLVSIKWKEVLQIGKKILHENPFEGQIWYPDGELRSNKFVHNLFCITWHWLPALLIDFLLLITLQKRFMIRLQTRIHNGLELLQFFTIRQWIFKSDNFLEIVRSVKGADKETFPIELENIDLEEYFKNALLGARQYLMKEPLSSLPRCRIQQKILFVLHKFCVYGFYIYLFWKVFQLAGVL